MAVLQESGASVAYCPRTHVYFGHDQIQRHAYREMLEAGINVALGTDSLASNPDLSVFSEAAFLWERDATPPYLLLEMLTVRGARALGLNAGALAEGKWGDVVVMAGEADTTVERVIESILRLAGSSAHVRAVWVGGIKVV